MRLRIKRNNKLYQKIVLWGLIPFAIGVICIIVGLCDPFEAYYVYVYGEPALTYLICGCAIELLNIAVCLAICLAKREKTTVKQ